MSDRYSIKRDSTGLCGASLVLTALAACSPPEGGPSAGEATAADIVLTNATVYTVDEANPSAESEILGPESEKLTVAEAIRAYTLDAAYAVEAERYSGSLEVGKRADFIVLDRNLFEIPEDDIVDTQVLRTVLNGRTVLERDSASN